MLTNDNNFRTSDFALTVSLMALGFRVVLLEKGQAKRITFVLEVNKNLSKAVNDYWQNELMLNPKDIFNAQKELKTRIYSGSEGAC